MATMKDYRDERVRKLDELKTLGFNAYPADSNRTIDAGKVVVDFTTYEGTKQTVAGRIKSIRKFGKLAFIVLKDFSGEVQLFIRDGDISATDAAKGFIGIKQLNLLDTGDFVEATGEVIKTKTGEISIGVSTLRLLSKSLRPMPLGHEEFNDKEERLRRRYIDINVNNDVRDRFVRRAKFWQSYREFMNSDGFLEMNIPVLEHTTGGADANPFVTHMDALDSDFYLRISHELPLKRLIGAGYEKVYDLGPRFRNEGIDEDHLPEHIATEWYLAYADMEQGIEFAEAMYKKIIQDTWGTLKFEFNGEKIDFSKKWERWDYKEVIQKHYGIDIYNTNIDELTAAIKKAKIETSKADNIPRAVDKLWKNIRKNVAGPIWLINTPKFISPLAKALDENTTQRFQPVFFGSEMGNGFAELNDPIDQLNRFVEQQQMRDAGDDEAMMLDIDFVEMLEYGMPPTCGYGMSERVFWLLDGVSAREGVPFPQMKTEISDVTREIYSDIKL